MMAGLREPNSNVISASFTPKGQTVFYLCLKSFGVKTTLGRCPPLPELPSSICEGENPFTLQDAIFGSFRGDLQGLVSKWIFHQIFLDHFGGIFRFFPKDSDPRSLSPLQVSPIVPPLASAGGSGVLDNWHRCTWVSTKNYDGKIALKKNDFLGKFLS